jgi:hypothetical protein
MVFIINHFVFGTGTNLQRQHAMNGANVSLIDAKRIMCSDEGMRNTVPRRIPQGDLFLEDKHFSPIKFTAN